MLGNIGEAFVGIRASTSAFSEALHKIGLRTYIRAYRSQKNAMACMPNAHLPKTMAIIGIKPPPSIAIIKILILFDMAHVKLRFPHSNVR